VAHPPLDDYAFLLQPVDPAHKAVVIEAGPDWRVDLPASVERRALWGRVPFRRPPSPGTLLRHLVAREKALRSLRTSRSGPAVKGIHRLSPPPGRPGPVQKRVRDFLLGGAVAELASANDVASILDEVVRKSGIEPEEGTFAPGSDRAATLLGRTNEGQRVVLRIGPSKGPSSPAAASTALDRLQVVGIDRVPRILDRGLVGEVAYAVESFVPGSRPRRIDDDLLRAVSSFLAELPRGDGPPTAPGEDLTELEQLVPSAAPGLARLREKVEPLLQALPSVMTHGDLWAGNVFVAGGSLSGVIDWDGAHPAGVPGTDLLHLVVSRQRRRNDGDMGAAWQSRPWRSQHWADMSAPYWRAFDLRVEDVPLDGVAVAWWAGWLRRAIERHDHRLEDARWMDANMNAVLSAALGE
jgi:Phosphotransferase enzyme family